MNNPLNEMPFDVNTLIPYGEFNWDTVSGIDAIHKDIMSAHQDVATRLMTPVVKLESNTNAVHDEIANQITNSIVPLEHRLQAVDSSIVGTLEAKTGNIQTSWGMPNSQLLWYYTLYTTNCNTWYGVLERRGAKPYGYSWLGGVPNVAALVSALRYMGIHAGVFQSDVDFVDNFSGHQEQILALYHQYEVNPDPTTTACLAGHKMEDIGIICNLQWNEGQVPPMDCHHVNPPPPPPPPTPPLPPQCGFGGIQPFPKLTKDAYEVIPGITWASYRTSTKLDCTYCIRSFNNHLIGEIPPSGYPGFIVGGYGSQAELHKWMYANFIPACLNDPHKDICLMDPSKCDINPPPPPPSPPPPPPPLPPLPPLPPPPYCSPCDIIQSPVKCPPPIINIPPCPVNEEIDLRPVLEEIRDKIGCDTLPSPPPPPPGEPDCKNMSDDVFNMSSCFEPASQSNIMRLIEEYSPDFPFISIKDSIEEFRKMNKIMDETSNELH